MVVLENLRSIVKSEKVRESAPHTIPLRRDKDCFLQVNIAAHFPNIPLWHNAAMKLEV